MSINELLNNIGGNIYEKRDILNIEKIGFPNNPTQKILRQVADIKYRQIKNFYEQVKSYDLIWKAKDSDKNPECNGYTQIIDYPNVLKERLFGDWFPEAIPEWYLEGKSTTFEHIEFYHFEVLEDGYGTGYFVGGDFDDTIYYHGNDRDIYSMDVDIDGYIQLLAKTYGLVYWQKVIIDIKNGTRSWEYDNFEGNMKVINPDFKMSEFEVFYNSIRLNRS